MKNRTVYNWMKKAGAFIMALTAGLGLHAGALAYSDNNIAASKAPPAVVIDGDLSEWNTQSPAVINQEQQVVRDKGQWTGPEDCGLEVYLMWDQSNLYLAARVTDDTPFMYREGFPPDMADSLVLFLSTDPGADPDRTAYAANDFRLTLVIDDYYFNTGIDREMVKDHKGFASKGADGDEQVLEGYECAVKEMDGGYTFECVIPLSNFANEQIPVLVPEAEMVLGVEFGMFDLDFPCPGVATVRMEWSANADVDTNPSLWGSLTLCE